jgi:hypothetical protein
MADNSANDNPSNENENQTINNNDEGSVDDGKVQEDRNDHSEPKDVEIEELIPDLPPTEVETKEIKAARKLKENRDVIYHVLHFLHAASIFISYYYRWDDILTRSSSINESLKISEFYDLIVEHYRTTINVLYQKQFPNTETYKPIVEYIQLVFSSLPVYMTAIEPDSIQGEVYSKMVSPNYIKFKTDDEVTIPDDYVNPCYGAKFNKLNHPYGNPDDLSMSLEEFKSHSLHHTSSYHNQRFDLTDTIQLTHPAARTQNDQQWMIKKATQLQFEEQNRRPLFDGPPSAFTLKNAPTPSSVRSVNPLPKASIGYQNHYFERELNSIVPNPARFSSEFTTPAAGINLNTPHRGTQGTYNSNLGGAHIHPRVIQYPQI